VLLLDTLGELSACWGLADVAFVGGSLTNRGGQNMIEPAGYGAALLFGPNTQNFRDVVEMLLAEDAARVVHDAADLAAVLADCLANPVRAQAQGARAQKLVLAQQGATARTVELLAGLSCFARLADSRAA
jgi:3-deoxy-D-manno-octulosonic-acid transferase